MPGFDLTSNISLPSAIQIDSATFTGRLVASTIRCNTIDAATITSITISLGSVAVTSDLQVTGIASANRVIATSNIEGAIGSFNRLVVFSNVQAVAASFTGNVTITGAVSFVVATPGVVTLGVGTAAISSDNAIALLPSNSIRFVAVGTVLQVYFNQTGTAVLRGVVNLATF